MQQVLNAPSMMNYKTMKCFYFERDGYCKYGVGCQFAHSDAEIMSANQIGMLSSIATAINCEMNNQYLNYNNNLYNNQFYNNYGDYNSYTQNNFQGQTNLNQQLIDETPDTNYGDQKPKTEQHENSPYPLQYLDPNTGYIYIYDEKTNTYQLCTDPNIYSQYSQYYQEVDKELDKQHLENK
jgi:hypothetical protein